MLRTIICKYDGNVEMTDFNSGDFLGVVANFSDGPVLEKKRKPKIADTNESLSAASLCSMLKKIGIKEEILVTVLASSGRIMIGGVTIFWDRLVKNFGVVSTSAITAMILATFTTPDMLLKNSIMAAIGYAFKTLACGQSLDNYGIEMPSTPLSLLASVGVGTLASGLFLDTATAERTVHSMKPIQTITGGSVIVATKHLFKSFQLISKAFSSRTFCAADIASNITLTIDTATIVMLINTTMKHNKVFPMALGHFLIKN